MKKIVFITNCVVDIAITLGLPILQRCALYAPTRAGFVRGVGGFDPPRKDD